MLSRKFEIAAESFGSWIGPLLLLWLLFASGVVQQSVAPVLHACIYFGAMCAEGLVTLIVSQWGLFLVILGFILGGITTLRRI